MGFLSILRMMKLKLKTSLGSRVPRVLLSYQSKLSKFWSGYPLIYFFFFQLPPKCIRLAHSECVGGGEWKALDDAASQFQTHLLQGQERELRSGSVKVILPVYNKNKIFRKMYSLLKTATVLKLIIILVIVQVNENNNCEKILILHFSFLL